MDKKEKSSEERMAQPSIPTESRQTLSKQPDSIAMSDVEKKLKKCQLTEKLTKAYIGLEKLKQKRARKKEMAGKFKKAKFTLTMNKGAVIVE